jgi:hypothetical protein
MFFCLACKVAICRQSFQRSKSFHYPVSVSLTKTRFNNYPIRNTRLDLKNTVTASYGFRINRTNRNRSNGRRLRFPRKHSQFTFQACIDYILTVTWFFFKAHPRDIHLLPTKLLTILLRQGSDFWCSKSALSEEALYGLMCRRWRPERTEWFNNNTNNNLFPSGTLIHYLIQFIRCYYITKAWRKLETVSYFS